MLCLLLALLYFLFPSDSPVVRSHVARPNFAQHETQQVGINVFFDSYKNRSTNSAIIETESATLLVVKKKGSNKTDKSDSETNKVDDINLHIGDSRAGSDSELFVHLVGVPKVGAIIVP